MLPGLMQESALTLERIVRRMETVTRASILTAATASGVVTSSYGDVAASVRRLAGALGQRGIAQGDRVVSLGFNTREHFELFLGVPAAGAVLHTANPRLDHEQLEYVLRHGGSRIAFVDASEEQALRPVLGRVATIEAVVVIGGGDREDSYERFLASGSGIGHADVVQDENQAASLCYTSGTTGRPKGVLYSHRSTFLHAVSLCMADVQAIGWRQTILPIVPFFHANGWGLPHAAGLAGANLVLPGADVSGRAVGELIKEYRVTIAAGVPTVLRDLLTYADANPGALESLEKIVSGGAALPRPIAEGFAQHGVEVVQGWGMTETSPCVTMSNVPPGVTDAEEAMSRRLTAGRLNPFVEARIVDADGEPLPWDGEAAGEIQLRSPHAARAYFQDADESRDKWAGEWLRTGDLASIDEYGYVRLRDRIKDLIKSGGEWIPTVDLETRIRSHDSVAEVAVVARADERWGERPAAFVVPRRVDEFDAGRLLADLRDAMPKWWLPDSITVVKELPLTTIGKVDKVALRGLANA